MFKKIIVLFLLLTPFIASAEVRFGALGIYSQSLYKQTSNEATLVPSTSYRGERFYLSYPEIGYRIIPQSPFQSLSAGLRHIPSSFDPDDSTNSDIQLLNDRDDSTLAFIAYRLGPITAKLAQDVSNTHNGYYGELSLGYPISINAWRIIPSINYQYISAKISDYMFGVSHSDSAVTDNAIPFYSSPATSRTSYGATAFYSITQNISTMISIRQTQYDEDVKQSPLVESNTVHSLLAGIFYTF